jgi:Flp pilus assembly protein TadG
MVVLLFFLLTFGMIDIGHVFFVQVTLQNAMRQAGRFAVTGNHLTQGGTGLTRVASIIQVAQQAAIGTDISKIQITSAQGGAGSGGGPDDTVIISLTTDLKLITPLIGRFFGPNGIYTFTVSTTFWNEPFPPEQAT